MRWRSHERDYLFRHATRHLSSVELTEAFFPKVSKRFEEIYFDVCKLPRLGEKISKTPTEFSLFVPSSPRYFISALKSPVKRASQHEVFFSSSYDRDTAYLLMNSSLMYWWWRVRDGGMTLSQETIHSLPVPEFQLRKKLIADLVNSEKKNKVYKQNAGAAQENVKHPIELVQRLNSLVSPQHASLLIQVHRNSDIDQHVFPVAK